ERLDATGRRRDLSFVGIIRVVHVEGLRGQFQYRSALFRALQRLTGEGQHAGDALSRVAAASDGVVAEISVRARESNPTAIQGNVFVVERIAGETLAHIDAECRAKNCR